MKKALMLDYDGVIVDSIALSAEKDNLLLAHYGKSLRVAPENIRAQWGRGWRRLYTELMGFTEAEIPRASAIRHELGKTLPHPPLFPGMADVITQLAKKYSLYVVSSSSTATILSALAFHGVGVVISGVFGQVTRAVEQRVGIRQRLYTDGKISCDVWLSHDVILDGLPDSSQRIMPVSPCWDRV